MRCAGHSMRCWVPGVLVQQREETKCSRASDFALLNSRIRNSYTASCAVTGCRHQPHRCHCSPRPRAVHLVRSFETCYRTFGSVVGVPSILPSQITSIDISTRGSCPVHGVGLFFLLNRSVFQSEGDAGGDKGGNEEDQEEWKES